MYDILENKQDLDMLDKAEPNLLTFNAKAEEYQTPDIDVIELHQRGRMVMVSKRDIEALAKHFDIVSPQ